MPAREGFVDGWVNSMWVATAVVAAALMFILVRGPRLGTAPMRSDDRQLQSALDIGA